VIEIPTLETERLVLRPWRESDIEAYAAMRADPVTMRFIGGAMTRQDTWMRLAADAGHWLLRGYGRLVVTEKATGAFIGYCGPSFPLGFPEPEIGWGLIPTAQGKGFATEAARCTLDYAYGVLGWTTAISLIASENYPSIRVAERLGARLDGTTEFRGMVLDIYRHPAPAQKLPI
jgi:RimJ/RimL family protein N-acetyltransferase